MTLKTLIDFPVPPPPRFSNIYLGYDLPMGIYEVSRDESFFLDPRGYSMVHVYEYISKNIDLLSGDLVERLFTRDSLEMILRDIDSKATAWWMGKILSQLCVDNAERSNLYMGYIRENYKHTEFYYRSKYLKLLSSVFIESDGLFKDKVHIFLKFFFKIILNCKYPNDIEFNLTFLYKMCTKHSKMRESVMTHFKEEMSKVELHIQNNLKTTYNNFKNPAFEDTERPALRSMLIKANQLAAGEPPNSNDFDSDDDIESRKVSNVSEVDVVDSCGQNWKRAKVVSQIGDLILVVVNMHTEWKDYYSDEVLPAGTKTYIPENT